MADSLIAPADHDLDAVLVARQKIDQARHPEMRFVDKVVVKDGPRAYKVVSHWVFVDRHTMETHHHAIRFETFTRKRDGWHQDRVQSFSLDNQKTDEIMTALRFLAATMHAALPDAAGRYLVIPVGSGSRPSALSAHNVRRLVELAQQSNIDLLTGIIESLHRNSNLVEISGETFDRFIELANRSSQDTLVRLFEMLLRSNDVIRAVQTLGRLDSSDIERLNTAVEIAILKNLITVWTENKGETAEGFWQYVIQRILLRLRRSSHILSSYCRIRPIWAERG
jgi:hypothetical protein